MMGDPYVNQYGILINKFGLSDQASLNVAEADAVYKRSVLLKLNPIKGDFDSEHLKSIHSYLFRDVYEWAGQFRTTVLAKRDPDHVTTFAPLQLIEEQFKTTNTTLSSGICAT